MRALFSTLALCSLLGGCGVDPIASCGDASYWSEHSADWPLDRVWVGDSELGLAEAMDRIELPATTAREALAASLVVAELNLAAGGDSEILALVYAGHGWIASDDGDPEIDAEAEALAMALDSAISASQCCPGC